MRQEVLALQQLNYGKHLGKNTAVKIAGEVRQLDILHAPALVKHNPLLLGRMAELAHRIAATCGITRATHKIVSIKMLVTPARVPGQPPLGEQLVHWDFSNAFLAQGMHTMLWHLSEAPGQRTTALPRFAAHHQPDERTTDLELRAFLPPLFDKSNYESEAASVGDVTFFDQRTPHFGTANESSEERVVVFVMFAPKGSCTTRTALPRCTNKSFLPYHCFASCAV
jgi:hypothetical protein